jgi:hypothetical protein
MDEQRLERALREGPHFRTRYVAQSLPADGTLPRPAISRRLVVVLATTAVLLMLTITALVLAGLLDRGVTGYALVVELSNEAAMWNGDAEEYVVTHTLYAPGTDDAAELTGLPSTARSVRWSPDGRRIAYFTQVWIRDVGAQTEGLYIAEADGRNPVRADLPRSAGDYQLGTWATGPVWAPSGQLAAFPAFDCPAQPGFPDCSTVFDVFDTDGRLVASIPTGNTFSPQPMWSPDGEWLGWAPRWCEDGPCAETIFHARSVHDVGREITLSFDTSAQVAWAPDGRLLVVEYGGNALHRPSRVYSVAPDGTDVEDVNWQRPLGGGGVEWIAWSPDGRHLALGYTLERPSLVRDLKTGLDSTLVTFRRSFAGWSPDAKRMVMWGGGQVADAFSVIKTDGTGLPVFLGEGTDIAWKPLR